tara:strand:- start:350 stop:583 length:234 start_codon:yes stop_codon:yes gene_type:complete
MILTNLERFKTMSKDAKLMAYNDMLVDDTKRMREVRKHISLSNDGINEANIYRFFLDDEFVDTDNTIRQNNKARLDV